MDRNQLLNDPEASIRYGLDGRQSRIWTALPGIIESVDLSAMTVSVQPAIQGVVTNPDGSYNYVKLPLLVDVPIIFPNGGGFSLTFPIEQGDECLVMIASRCIDSWWQNGGIGIPMEDRMHDLSDGFCLVGPRSQPNVIGSVSPTTTQLRNHGGTVMVEVTNTRVNILGDVYVTGDVIANGISLVSHIHSNVTNGPSDTGAPV